jgi:hypothetical protein
MSLKIARATPSSAVADNGEINFTYPDGTDAGSYASYGHKAFVKGLQNYLSQDAGDFRLDFETTGIEFNYFGSTSIPANTEVVLQINMVGQDDREPWHLDTMSRMCMAPLVRMDLGAPDTADDNGIVESQDLTAAGVYSVLAFNGVYGDPYGNDYAVLDVPRNVVAAWTTSAVLTVTGEDEYGNTMVESSASGTSFTGKKAFKRIDSIATDTNITSLTVGTGDVLGLPVFIEKKHQIVMELKDGVAQGRLPGKVYLQGLALEAAVDGATGYNFVSPVAGKVTKVWAISQTGTTTGGAITAEIATVAINGLSVVVADSSSEGDVDSDIPTLDHATTVVAAGDRVEVQFASGFSGATDLAIVVEITTDQDTALNGTLVAGVQTAATATTGDVRGTYDPYSACDGALSFTLIAMVPDPTYKGVNQYDG